MGNFTGLIAARTENYCVECQHTCVGRARPSTAGVFAALTAKRSAGGQFWTPEIRRIENGFMKMTRFGSTRNGFEIPVQDQLTVDVVVVGGITGVTAAYFSKSGLKVAYWSGTVWGVDTSYTTAHLTCVTDARLHKLESTLGSTRRLGRRL
jgi:hypothetical protein